MSSTSKPEKKLYDVIVFGVTGFTGKLAVEYLLEQAYPISWAACGRNESKTKAVLQDIVDTINNKQKTQDQGTVELPPIVTADLVPTTPEQEDTLRALVQQTKVVLTMAGPYEKYGKTLVQLCATHGVHYADITGETDFVRHSIANFDQTARQTKACIIHHCGNDCIPQDLMVYELHRYAQQQQSASKNPATLIQVQTFPEFPGSASMSGGTAHTAVYQLGKSRPSKKDKDPNDFDPLLKLPTGEKSSHGITNISTKELVYDKHVGHSVGPWIMGPVMVNCIRRSNALLHYHYNLRYGDALVKSGGVGAWLYETTVKARMATAMALPSFLSSYIIPQPGQGPDRQVMEDSYLKLHAIGTLRQSSKDDSKTEKDSLDTESDEITSLVRGTFEFRKDISYLYTAHLLVQVGMVLLEKDRQGTLPSGVLTPAVALGHDLTERILQTLDATLTIAPLEEEEAEGSAAAQEKRPREMKGKL